MADYFPAVYGGSRDGQLDYTVASVKNEARCRSQKFRVEELKLLNIDSNYQPCVILDRIEFIISTIDNYRRRLVFNA